MGRSYGNVQIDLPGAKVVRGQLNFCADPRVIRLTSCGPRWGAAQIIKRTLLG
jgi:hypothetical protein